MDYYKLLEKYWEGETSIEEEKALKIYFQGDEIASDLMPYKSLFDYTSLVQKRQLDRSVVQMIQPSLKGGNPLFSRFGNWSLLKIAAAILLVIFSTIGFLQLSQTSKEERLAKYWASKEIKDPQLAYQKTKASLLFISKKLNSGTQAAIEQVAKVQRAGKSVSIN